MLYLSLSSGYWRLVCSYLTRLKNWTLFILTVLLNLNKLEVLSLFNFKKSDDLDFKCLNGLTNLRLVNHWRCHSELVQLLHSQANATIISQPECLLQNIYELNI